MRNRRPSEKVDPWQSPSNTVCVICTEGNWYTLNISVQLHSNFLLAVELEGAAGPHSDRRACLLASCRVNQASNQLHKVSWGSN